MDEEVLAAHVQELRRGSIVVAALALLDDPRYGYALLGELHDVGFDVDANTLYPLLRRLERQGLLRSEWNTDETRPRKFYVLSEEGVAIREALAAEWSALDDRVRHVLKGTSDDHPISDHRSGR